MEKIILDANVITKWYIIEENSDKALLLQKRFVDREIEIIVPSLLYLEVLNALKYSSLFEKAELNSIGESLEKYGFTFTNVAGEIREIMIELVMNHQISIYDASYIALSISLGVSMCTNDEKIRRKLPTRLKKKVILLREYQL
jgi:predicted nucleic acid-binding protein